MGSGISSTRQNKTSWSHASRRCRWPLVKGSVTLVLWHHKHYLQETAYILRIKMCSRCSKALTSQHLVLVYGKFCGNVILSYILRMARIMAKPHVLNIVLDNLSPKYWGFLMSCEFEKLCIWNILSESCKSKFCSSVGAKQIILIPVSETFSGLYWIVI